MVVILLESFHYPSGQDWQSIKVANPDWSQVNEALDRLDRDEWPFIWLHTEAPPKDEFPDNMLCVMGGRGEFSISLNHDGDEIEFVDQSRKKNGELIRIWESDQGTERLPFQLCNNRNVAFKIVESFCNSGALDSHYQWRTV